MATAALRYASRVARPSFKLYCPSRKLASLHPQTSLFAPLDVFPERHIGPDDQEASLMLSKLGYNSMDAFIQDTIPHKIRVSSTTLETAIPALSESGLHKRAKVLAAENIQNKSYIGMGYHNAVVPPVILRNVCLPPVYIAFDC